MSKNVNRENKKMSMRHVLLACAALAVSGYSYTAYAQPAPTPVAPPPRVPLVLTNPGGQPATFHRPPMPVAWVEGTCKFNGETGKFKYRLETVVTDKGSQTTCIVDADEGEVKFLIPVSFSGDPESYCKGKGNTECESWLKPMPVKGVMGGPGVLNTGAPSPAPTPAPCGRNGGTGPAGNRDCATPPAPAPRP